MDLPYSVIRGEEVAIKVVVFNYETEDMEVLRDQKIKPTSSILDISASYKISSCPGENPNKLTLPTG
jgi:hypothetical protein